MMTSFKCSWNVMKAVSRPEMKGRDSKAKWFGSGDKCYLSMSSEPSKLHTIQTNHHELVPSQCDFLRTICDYDAISLPSHTHNNHDILAPWSIIATHHQSYKPLSLVVKVFVRVPILSWHTCNCHRCNYMQFALFGSLKHRISLVIG